MKKNMESQNRSKGKIAARQMINPKRRGKVLPRLFAQRVKLRVSRNPLMRAGF